jgi:hypothetical protein
MDLSVILALSVAGLVALEKILNRGIYKNIKKMQHDIQEIKTTMGARKEEGTLLIDATDAAVDATIELGGNGGCTKAKQAIAAYRDKCLQNRA